jgi:putative membrane-bound dehydrogenase-like protein
MSILNFNRNCSFGSTLTTAFLFVGGLSCCLPVSAADSWRVGVAKVDVTPTEPVRLSGYAVRVASHTGVADPLAARAMVISPADSTQADSAQADSAQANSEQATRTLVLVSIDSIGVTSEMTVALAHWLEEQYSIPRSQLVVCSTHSHAAPHVAGLLKNIYREPSTADQEAATLRYTERMSAGMRQAITEALAARQPATLSLANAEATFAINRRVLKQGLWTGFGLQADGVVDHRVRLMIARAPAGTILGASFLYACHCTTLGGDVNQVSGDWAGLSAHRLEQLHPGSVFLPVIGCGADANPNPRTGYEDAQRHAAELVTAIESQLADPQSAMPLATDQFPVAHFGYAGLAPEQPTTAYLAEMADRELPNDRRWAEEMLKIKREMGRLPETYPMPIHTWQFGDQLTWVFLGGEVVVDYQFQIEKELPTQQTWVAAYTDDVFAYVASQRMRDEGGYEVDSSMIYYLQPGRWQSGTQSLIVRRVREILNESHSEEQPLGWREALQAIHVPDDYRVELVAAEPLVQDPVNLSFGPDGRVWVVEMSDYPLGVSGGGRVKWLRDTDADGQLDEAQIFVEGLSYPTSAIPWRDGVLIIAAPDVLFAQDTNADGRADRVEPWLSGLEEANPQHRASGFEIGLDGWLHLGSGHGTKQLISHRNGITYALNSRDFSWNPDTGEIKANTGETQFIRSRDDFGVWFGNSNSKPMYQYVIEDRYLDGQSISGGPRQDLLTPAVAPPVYPRSRTLDRFNDLYALNRFTSACSSIIVRAPGVGSATGTSALVCEPVHNLVARIELDTSGSSFSATHQPAAGKFDFFTSTDPWSRPVRAVNAPDGSVWIVDMVRRVIEHPEWIPTAWQQRLDLRAGAQLGRIYRVVRRDFDLRTDLQVGSEPGRWLAALSSDNGAMRDLALQAILHSDASQPGSLQVDIRRLATSHASPAVRAAALGCLSGKGWLTATDVSDALLKSDDPGLLRWALELSENFPQGTLDLQVALTQLVERHMGPMVDLQWVLTSTRLPSFDARPGLMSIASRASNDLWILKALSLVREPNQALAVTQLLLSHYASTPALSPQTFAEVEQCLSKLWQRCDERQRAGLATTTLSPLLQSGSRFDNGQLLLLSCIAQNKSGNQASSTPTGQPSLKSLLDQITQQIVEELPNNSLSEAEQLSFINLIGSGLTSEDNELQMVRAFLQPDRPLAVRRTTLESVRRMRGTSVGNVLIGYWPELNSALRSSAGATLLSRREWAQGLVEALETGTIPMAELDLSTLGQLSRYGDRELRNRCLELLGQSTERSVVVAKYLADIPAPKKTAQGEKLFADHCAACHRAVEGKPMLGPPLENLRHWTLDQWVTAVLDPNQTVEPKYRQSTLLTSDGQVVAGLILERSQQDLLVGVSDGSTKRIALSDIEDEKEAGPSLMPAGFEQKFTPEQLSELIGYLREVL